MSEITKACPNCLGAGTANGPIPQEERVADGPAWAVQKCSPCKGTGRVPDVEATLRAEMARLTEERDYYKSERERLLPLAIQARKDAPSPVVVLPHGAAGDIVALRAEVARLAGRERDAADLIRDAANDPSGLHSEQGWTRARAAWLAGCRS